MKRSPLTHAFLPTQAGSGCRSEEGVYAAKIPAPAPDSQL